jgi:hypothetical protein
MPVDAFFLGIVLFFIVFDEFGVMSEEDDEENDAS